MMTWGRAPGAAEIALSVRDRAAATRPRPGRSSPPPDTATRPPLSSNALQMATVLRTRLVQRSEIDCAAGRPTFNCDADAVGPRVESRSSLSLSKLRLACRVRAHSTLDAPDAFTDFSRGRPSVTRRLRMMLVDANIKITHMGRLEQLVAC